ncbi:MAG TPA: 50S ribosomal protein L4 [Candidatus Marinimicrobia bacterium]|nr:MAG: 50S ribosomal protein L4 [Candidatus Marinimicrobia bacterium CG1_02_48_14]PIZ62857.1 MAG: 50S ribosomal protein L4 [Candidatus Marinimicrobia bacterium CG_4_10_14_0_2_um_filter_48_9]PJA54089.1 MAG: 50S ribosomal protein L4 [Candidatus Marinimicrobia bacterium CG_4_9_14_3_um_filter_48_9]HCW75792.1 50S ribosomal protein L4 [Candidatus Neomarinimicrobiota bacterium]
MKFDIFTHEGKQTTQTVEGFDSVFGVTPNQHTVYMTVKSEMGHLRQGTAKTKTRSEVSGGGKKPWKQKGRGGARSGSNRSPVWVGGGRAFGPVPRTYDLKVNKKVKQNARRSVLSDKVANSAVKIVDTLVMTEPKTKNFLQMLTGLGVQNKKVLFLISAWDDNFYLAGRNLGNVAIVETNYASAYDLLDNEVIVMDEASVAILNDQLGV